MEDHRGSSSLRSNSNLAQKRSHKIVAKVASMPDILKQKSLSIAPKDRAIIGVAGDVTFFLLKVAALETTRRLSRAKCPFVWHSLQAFQMLLYPPFKWIQRWAPFKGLVHAMQMLSRPLLVLSIATAFSVKDTPSISNDNHDSHELEDEDEESSSDEPDVVARNIVEYPSCPPSENWLHKLYEELERQGISLPERIDESELRRFYNAANGNFACLLSSIKKTIRWRETYHILSEHDLKAWSNIVFWHGYDMRHRPCLIVRLGVACTNLPNHDRPRFAQAVVSQMEYGILRLADRGSPQIMVLVDCEGLLPFRLPMQMIRSCCLLFQDHFPHCLGGLYVIRLPPVIRMMVQTLMKVLKPTTQQRLKFLGQQYKEILSEFFQDLPACVGGKCMCEVCSSLTFHNARRFTSREMANQLLTDGLNCDDEDLDFLTSEFDGHPAFDQGFIRTCVTGILILFVIVALLAGIFDLESHPNLFL